MEVSGTRIIDCDDAEIIPCDSSIATIIAHKIVCTDENELPNGWIGGDESITVNTAIDWVNSHGSCEFASDWTFQWAPDPAGATNPGDNIGEDGNPWITSNPTSVNGRTEITIDLDELSADRIWLREVPKSGFLPFSGTLDPTGPEVSAEFYCNDDVLNYDNLEWIGTDQAPITEQTYYCVAFNVPEEPLVPSATIIAHKIVCENEIYLPDLGSTAVGEIDENTASTFISENTEHCWFEEDWDFEWGYDNEVSKKPGDYTGYAGGNWHPFDSKTGSSGEPATATITNLQGTSNLWVREVLKEGYIPFSSSGDEVGSDISAEMYCHQDVYKYDNYDKVDGPQLDNTYYCVGFNTPIEEEPKLECIAGINLLKNGGFEFPEVTDSKKWQLFPSGTLDLGWLVEWVDNLITDPALLELQRKVNDWKSSEGDQHAELDSDHPTMISQEIQTLPGYEYTLTFDFSARPKTDLDNNKLEIHTDGNLLGTTQKANSTNQTVWESKTYNFVADSGITEIKFLDTGIDDSLGIFLDNVSLECVGPEQQPICGNENIETGEQCDPPSTIISIQDNQFCDQNCQIVPIYNGDNSCPEGTEPKFIQSYSIGSQDINGEVIPVDENKVYLFAASDTFYPTQDGKNQSFKSDAAYTTEDGWTSISTQYGIQGIPPDYAAHALLGDLGLGVGVINWGDYDSSHEYNFSYTIPSSFTSAQFVIGDRYGDWFDTPWQNQVGMSDNEDSLTLDVYECKPNGEPNQTECTPGEDPQSCLTDQLGICSAGTQTCDLEGMWGECIAENEPTTEICDNEFDDDCDGLVDSEDPDCQQGTTTTTTSAGGTSGGGSYPSQYTTTTSAGRVLGAAVEKGKETGTCSFYLLKYIKLGTGNDPFEVKKLQLFLNWYQNANLEVTGIYDQSTYEAVKEFQLINLG